VGGKGGLGAWGKDQAVTKEPPRGTDGEKVRRRLEEVRKDSVCLRSEFFWGLRGEDAGAEERKKEVDTKIGNMGEGL